MATSTADLINWRGLYPAPPVSTRPPYPFNSRGQSLESMGAINRMPHVWDPQAFTGMTTEQMLQWLMPGGRRKINLGMPMSQDELSALNDLNTTQVAQGMPRANWQNVYPPMQMNLFQHPMPTPWTQTQYMQYAGASPTGSMGNFPPPPPAGPTPLGGLGLPGQAASLTAAISNGLLGAR